MAVGPVAVHDPGVPAVAAPGLVDIGLTWDNVSDHVLLIDVSSSYGETRDTKTGHARTVELVEPHRDDLAEYRPARTEPGALVLPNRDGGYIDLHAWRRLVAGWLIPRDAWLWERSSVWASLGPSRAVKLVESII